MNHRLIMCQRKAEDRLGPLCGCCTVQPGARPDSFWILAVRRNGGSFSLSVFLLICVVIEAEELPAA